MFCNHCGMENSNNDIYCKGCGNLIQQNNMQNGYNPMQQQQQYGGQVQQNYNQAQQPNYGYNPNQFNNAYNPNQSYEKKRGTGATVAGYTFGTVFLIAMLGYFMYGDIISGLLMIPVVVLLYPFLSDLIKEKLNINIPTAAKVAIVIVLWLIGGNLATNTLASVGIKSVVSIHENKEEKSEDEKEDVFSLDFDNIKTDNKDKNKSDETSIDNKQKSDLNISTPVTGKASSKSNPLAIGEWGIACQYSDGEYVDIPVKITKVTRGSSVNQKVKEYFENRSFFKYEEPKEGMEWVVVEYIADLTNAEEYSMGKSVNVLTSVAGSGGSAGIVHNGYRYYSTTTDMDHGYTKSNIGTSEFVVQLPIGCTDYVIILGSSSGSQAYFKGQ